LIRGGARHGAKTQSYNKFKGLCFKNCNQQ